MLSQRSLSDKLQFVAHLNYMAKASGTTGDKLKFVGHKQLTSSLTLLASQNFERPTTYNDRRSCHRSVHFQTANRHRVVRHCHGARLRRGVAGDLDAISSL